ncbi:TNF receptor-associated factor family protein DDB_G0272829-like [Prunus dulcis]|uniref:TNF receptor-associated factor family protein DDB_G0272829-like n=1 Tax=Prunus dulcis TaxID=3755 RepID=UPI0014833AA5|nr:TNF receptor-associated factor family protein DDB_G0272829-like [Prunus dulcis]
MLFYLTTKKLASVCTAVKPYASDNPTPEQTWALQTWTENDFLCNNYILNGLSDDLYDYYSSYDTAKDLWDALQKKYDTEEAGAKKFVVSRYLKFQMVDETVEAQSHELQKIAHEIIIEGMNLDEQFQVTVIIDKLPPSWKDFKNAMRHKTKEFSLESLITRLRIEEEARKHDMKEEVLLVSNNKKNHNSNRNQTPTALKTNGKNMKNQNMNRNNNNQNRNGQHNQSRNPEHHQNRNLH